VDAYDEIAWKFNNRESLTSSGTRSQFF